MANPKLRPVQPHLIDHEGQPYILLQDPLGLIEGCVAVPEAAGPLLALCDGSRNFEALKAGFEIRTGMAIELPMVEQIIDHLDEALLLDNEKYAKACDDLQKHFRNAPFRTPALAGRGYPANSSKLSQMLDQYISAIPKNKASKDIKGVISPHIDFIRGGPVYAEVWSKAAKAINEAELVIILGTDHQGGRNLFTLTEQNYSTPWGALPTDVKLVNKIAGAIGSQNAFEGELHHRSEHSIELALVWLHYFLGNRKPKLVPILTGSFEEFMHDGTGPENNYQISSVVGIIKEASKSRRTLVIAAADLAHMGPAFGDDFPMEASRQATVTAADDGLIKAMCLADAGDFFGQIKQEGDRRRICGLAPIYLTLRILSESTGNRAGYALCPADETNSSLVSICGVTLS